jgi:hypothetical protein
MEDIKNYEKFTEGAQIETTVFMSTEDVGGEEDLPVGTKGIVWAGPPSDEEESVPVVIKGLIYYIDQMALEVI